MIIRLDFPEYEEEILEIDKLLAYVNLIIKKAPKGVVPHCHKGVITINDRKSNEVERKKYTLGITCHESAHLLTDPITYGAYVDGIHAIKKGLSVDAYEASLLANTASDLIVETRLSKTKKLSRYSRDEYEVVWKDSKGKLNPMTKELFGIYKRLHKCRYKGVKSKHFNRVKRILGTVLDRNERYVEIAKLFKDDLEKTLEQAGKEGKPVFGEGELDKRLIQMPIVPTGEEEREAVERVIGESKTVDEAEEKLETMKGVGCEPAEHALRDMDKLLVRFYEGQARKVILSIEWPKVPTVKGVKLGSRKWRPEHGLKAIDVKRTVIKHGVNIPLVTTQSARILPKFISESRESTPIDLVVSIDVSGSTGQPLGEMSDASDYETAMFYALVNLARKVQQKVGLTLWETYVEYTTLPDVMDWRDSDRLKRTILEKAWGGGTDISVALNQARQYANKLFFVFTDGYVNQEDLIDAPNTMFFLVKPSEHDEGWFVELYGRERVVRIDDLESLPHLTLRTWRRMFWS